MTVNDILSFLNNKFPIDTACDFDNVGLLIGDKDQTVTKAIIALDCTMSAINEAIANDCELIITHHPVIFNPLKNILKGSIPHTVVSNNLSVISMHTNLDVGDGGVNDNLCKVLEPIMTETVVANDGYLLKKCTISPICADDLALKLKTSLGGRVKYTDNGKTLENILVCSGSGGNFIYEVKDFDCDALLTADVKHNQFLDAELLGVSLFDAGHFNTEDIVIEPLKELLQTEFSDVEFITNHNSAIKYL
ncbi:MAG: Nif3-like dinuclear metal center hexameric protein [Ruminococcaceae bacterium]|nr:Nif3-like dinuclear metal center hexameric protein [Oscillospiraceae bacterium]